MSAKGFAVAGMTTREKMKRKAAKVASKRKPVVIEVNKQRITETHRNEEAGS